MIGLPDWQNIIDTMISILKPNGGIMILEWYLEKTSLRAIFVKWIGKGEVGRSIWHYLKTKVSDFEVEKFGLFKGVFLASGTKMETKTVIKSGHEA
jgi:hypothetical protein